MSNAVEDLTWQSQGECSKRRINSDRFFDEVPSEPVLAACAACPVQAQCRAFGMTQEFGIWGGLSESDRKSITSITKPRPEVRPEDSTVQHGTYAGYTKLRCREACCRAAKARYVAEARAARRALAVSA